MGYICDKREKNMVDLYSIFTCQTPVEGKFRATAGLHWHFIYY